MVLNGFYFNGESSSRRVLNGLGLEFLFNRVKILMLEKAEICQDEN